MNFLKRLLGRKDIYPKSFGCFFTVQDTVITNPIGWSKEIELLVDTLTQEDKDMLLKLCKILQEHLKWHFVFLFSTDFIKVKFNDDPDLLFKSYFELLMIDWIIIGNYFKKRNVKYEVGQTLWWVLYYSFYAYQKILFTKENYKNYEDAFGNRGNLYPKILTNYYSNDEYKNKLAIQNLFTLLIAIPLTNDTANLDKESYGVPIINGIRDYHFSNNMIPLWGFHLSFPKGIEKLRKEINSTL